MNRAGEVGLCSVKEPTCVVDCEVDGGSGSSWPPLRASSSSSSSSFFTRKCTRTRPPKATKTVPIVTPIPIPTLAPVDSGLRPVLGSDGVGVAEADDSGWAVGGLAGTEVGGETDAVEVLLAGMTTLTAGLECQWTAGSVQG